MLLRLLGIVFCVSIALAEPGGVLVIAPHPDDEVIGCAGVILRALEAKKRVTVVLLTNGDGHVALTAVVARKEREQLTPEDFMKAGALRQGHSIAAMKRLGVPREDLIFLGYPDGGLEKKAALIKHTKGTSPVHDGLVDEYLKPEELFWQFPIP